jgi:hypothetical protein
VYPGLAVALLGGCVLATAAADKITKPDAPGTVAILDALRQWFDDTDKNSDGYLDKDELADVDPDYAFLKQLDKDRDGMISRDEFESWART